MGRKAMGHAAHDNDKAFPPHAEINDQRYDKEGGDRRANFFKQKQQRDQSDAQNHEVKSPAVITRRAPAKLLHFHRVVAVPGDEKFRCIGKADNQTGEDDGLGDIF